MIGREARRQHEADSPAASGQRERALEEDLIAVDVPGSLMPVDAGASEEVSSRVRPRAACPTADCRAPRRSRRSSAAARVVEIRFGKFEHPVEESDAWRQCRRASRRSAVADVVSGRSQRPRHQLFDERCEHRRVGRAAAYRATSSRRTTDRQSTSIARELRSRSSRRSFSRTTVGGVIACLRQPAPLGDSARERRLEIGIRERAASRGLARRRESAPGG